MALKDLISKEIENIPEEYLEEVLDFIRFVGKKAMTKKMEMAIASETSLEKDWLRPEEEEAWRDL